MVRDRAVGWDWLSVDARVVPPPGRPQATPTPPRAATPEPHCPLWADFTSPYCARPSLPWLTMQPRTGATGDP